MARKKSLPEPALELPIRYRPCSNGEAPPRAETPRDRAAVEMFARRADENARARGISRRTFVRSACGMATALSVLDLVYGCGTDGPGYAIDPDAGRDPDAACAALASDAFVFDVQTHHVDPFGAWRERDRNGAVVSGFPYAGCGEPDRVVCFGVDHFVREVFVRSDTAVACLTGLPASPENDPLPTSARVTTREIVRRLSGTERLLIHANVAPERGPAELDAMQAAAERDRVAAWKIYPSAGRFRFDDERVGIPFVERARAVGVKIVCAHLGIAGDDGAYDALSSPRDMAKVARAYPDMCFLVYHSAWEAGVREGPYDASRPRGVDRMVRALEEHPSANLYAELGSTFRNLMTDPEQLAHVLGKLLKHFGPDRVLWGTDCIWFGSPSEQLAAFRAFQIPEAMQAAHGYPALTEEVKRKVLGLNAARVYGVDPAAARCAIREDDVQKLRQAMMEGEGEDPLPLRDYGPRTRRELLRMLRG